ncbi:uncharacterized protein [Nicotiana sylvestris]|uniref:uncharacterized protein n=1 Tax=Nicotiana sylvestris TaxID=4096 RepID=UPI00388CDF80
MGLLQPVPPNRQNLESPSYRPGTRCAYHSGAEGHATEVYWTLKSAIENLIEQKRVVLRDEEVPNVTNNPLPSHNNGLVIGMICEDKEFNPVLKCIIAIADSEKNPKCQNDLPPEGGTHNKALHLTVKCKGYYVKRVMLDGGSGVDICPLSTLQRMEIGTERIRPNNVCVRALDGVKWDTIGEIDLVLTIGPIDFEVTFQVLDMDTSYNFLLGRPWIHATGVVPFTFHQTVNFKHENQEIVVHGEDEQSIYKDPSVPCLEAKEGSKHIIYQAFENMVAD